MGKTYNQAVEDDIQESIMQLETVKSKMALYPENDKILSKKICEGLIIKDLQKL